MFIDTHNKELMRWSTSRTPRHSSKVNVVLRLVSLQHKLEANTLQQTRDSFIIEGGVFLFVYILEW